MILRLTALLLTVLSCAPLWAEDESLRTRNDAIIVRAVQRMPGYDYSNDEHVKAAINRHIARSEGTPQYLRLIKQFRPDGMADQLEQMLLGRVNDSVKVEAAEALGNLTGGPQKLRAMLKRESVGEAASVATILGLLGNGRATKMLSEVASDVERPYDVRKNAVIGLARNQNGEKALISMVESRTLAADTRLLAGGLLARSRNAEIKKRAAELLPQPKQKDQKPLAPIDQLAAIQGDPVHGMKLFRGVATCANCHVVQKHGKEVGPDLSEIGSKLSREAMFTSILDPSAGISHNYENYIVLTASGQVINGLKVSETPQEITIRTAEAIDRKIPQDEVEQIKKSEKSIMPDNLHLTIDQQGLIDVVAYMTTLKKK